MREKNKRNKRVRKLTILCALIAVILAVATYAWFIGMRTVYVSSFDVEIASTESLLLSLDGQTFTPTVSIDSENFDDEEHTYAGNTNWWAGEDGLVPMSSIGTLDETSSRMELFEKASLTATPGGYRLMASRVNNYGTEEAEKDGYVAFDLFIKNFSGSYYFGEEDLLEEEAIYMTVDSSVTVAQAGGESEGGVQGTGIENSVRVAFAQIGRVEGTTDTAADGQATITGITCADDEEAGVTGICRNARIWEPNDRDHVDGAIKWYNESCKPREAGSEDLSAGSYSDEGTCGVVTNGLYYPTYAVNQPVLTTHDVDVYDGAAYNTFTESAQLSDFQYFKDSDKLLRGIQRPAVFTLAPNSITKVRIYIYLEGQDIDNYDFASIGKKIAVKFGFTKERFVEDDIGYGGPDVNQGEGPLGADLTPPVITLNGTETVNLTVDGTYNEEGATATDNVNGTVAVTTIGSVNTHVAGTYMVLYRAEDTAGNVATKTRTVVVGTN